MVKDHRFEDLQERILEMMTKDPTFIEAVQREFEQRFPNATVNPGMDAEHDEITCMCQIIVGRDILKGIL